MQSFLLILAVLIQYCALVTGRERLFESAERWTDKSISAGIRFSCIRQGYANEIDCRCAWNAGLVPSSLIGQTPPCTEKYACEWNDGSNCDACNDPVEDQFTCRGLADSRNLRRGYSITVFVLFGLLVIVGVPMRMLAKKHPLKGALMKRGTMTDIFARTTSTEETPADLAWMQTIGNWQWTFYLVFVLPCVSVVGSLLSIILIGNRECFWDSKLQMPRWDHYSDSILMPNGDWEEDWAFPAVSNLPEMYVECADRDKWIFASTSRFNTSEFFNLFFALTALLIIPAAHTLVAHCRLVLRIRGGWPNAFYLTAICLLAGIVGIANVQGAYGKPETDAHFVLSIIYFVFSFLFDILVCVMCLSMNSTWAPRWRISLLLAILAILTRIAYVIMYFISDVYPDNHNRHLTIYSTQNFLTWLFTFFQCWMVQSFPQADVVKLRPKAAAPQPAPVPPMQPWYPPQPEYKPPPPPEPEPVQESMQMAPVFIPDGTIPLLGGPPPPPLPHELDDNLLYSSGLNPYTEASLVHARAFDEHGFLPIMEPAPAPLDTSFDPPNVVDLGPEHNTLYQHHNGQLVPVHGSTRSQAWLSQMHAQQMPQQPMHQEARAPHQYSEWDTRGPSFAC